MNLAKSSKLRLQMIPAIVLKFLLLSIAYANSQVIEIVQNSADKLRDRYLACIFEVYVTFVSYYMACNVPSMYHVSYTCVGRKLVLGLFVLCLPLIETKRNKRCQNSGAALLCLVLCRTWYFLSRSSRIFVMLPCPMICQIYT